MASQAFGSSNGHIKLGTGNPEEAPLRIKEAHFRISTDPLKTGKACIIVEL